mmetsp:Transcript_4794/g.4047  ORF Transcript_4794/g.4047 Transcript_4794/m.4047 type:complete len:126 (+) Transcript_4794:260-637(+)
MKLKELTMKNVRNLSMSRANLLKKKIDLFDHGDINTPLNKLKSRLTHKKLRKSSTENLIIETLKRKTSSRTRENSLISLSNFGKVRTQIESSNQKRKTMYENILSNNPQCQKLSLPTKRQNIDSP